MKNILKKCYNRRMVQYAGAVLLLLLTIALVVAGIKLMVPENRIRPLDPSLIEAGKEKNQYEIHVVFNPEDKTLTCHQKVAYRNNSSNELTHIYYHLYPNAFKYEEKPAFPLEEMEQAYPNGFSSGYIEIEQVYIHGSKAGFVVGGYSEDTLMVLLKGPLKPSETVVIEFDYTVKLPNSLGRFGYGENTTKAANWYPIASVYDENGWNLHRYYPIGDPFYSDVSNYKVIIDAPSNYLIASTGDILSKTEYGSGIEWEIQGTAVRDFAWLASDRFKVSTRQVEGTTVYSYYYTEPYGIEALDYAASALEIYNRSFGLYPYRQLSVVESDFFIGGMEYPNLIMIDTRLYKGPDLTWLEIVTVHETAHQWWYGLVGNNQVEEAWLDEALTEYATVLYYGHRYGPDREEEIYQNFIAEGKYHMLEGYIRALGKDETIHRATYEFADWILYDVLVYGKGAMMFHEIHKKIGDPMFYTVLQTYLETYRFKNATKKDLIEVFNEVTKEDWTVFFNNWLFDNKNE